MKRHEVNDLGSTSPTALGKRMEKLLSAYAENAAAAGVTVMALALPGEARVVYTPASIPVPANGGWVGIDLNHDGIADLSFSNRTYNWIASGADLLQVKPTSNANAVWGRGTFQWFYRGSNTEFAAALRPGFILGPSKSYFNKGRSGLLGFIIGSLSSSRTSGQWLYTKGRYLGVQFQIDGKTHYGWARLTVSGPQEGGLSAIVTGYAYETVPNKPIITGKTKGPDVVTIPMATLGGLARGAKQ